MQTQTTNPFHLPNADELEKLLTDLLGMELDFSETQAATDFSEQVVVTYVDENGTPAVTAICELAFANGVGAALARIPPALASDSSQAGVCPDNLKSNFEEVMNIGAGLFTSRSSSRLTFKAVNVPPHGEELAAEIALTEGEGAAYQIDLGNYGVGKISVHLLNPAPTEG